MNCQLLDRRSAHTFRLMTFPAYWRLLDPEECAEPVVAIGCWDDGRPAGLALAAMGPGHDAARLLSLYVEGHCRGRGVATCLLGKLEGELARGGATEVVATYMTGPTTAALEAVLHKRAWSEPQPRMLVIRCSLESVRRAPWAKRYPLPSGWRIVPWVEVGDAARQEIRRTQERESWVPSDLMPFDHESGLEPNTSLALVVEGVVRGWLITHVVGDVLRYSCAFVHRDLQGSARLVLLINEAIARMPGIGLSVGMWTTPLAHQRMVRFVRRRMQPYSIFFGETRGVGKRLAREAEK